MRIIALGFAALAMATSVADAKSFVHFKDTSKFTLVGAAASTKTSDNWVLRLVQNQPYLTGAAYLTQPVTLGKKGQFSTVFHFRVTNPSAQPADGLTFVLAQSPTGLGSSSASGQYLGYAGVANSMAVEFDWYDNFGQDAAPNEVAVDLGGSVATLNAPAGSWGQPYLQGSCSTAPAPLECMSDGNIWTATITYDGKVMNVIVQDGSGAPYHVITNYPVDLPSQLGGTVAYAGFTAATGGENSDVDLLDLACPRFG